MARSGPSSTQPRPPTSRHHISSKLASEPHSLEYRRRSDGQAHRLSRGERRPQRAPHLPPVADPPSYSFVAPPALLPPTTSSSHHDGRPRTPPTPPPYPTHPASASLDRLHRRRPSLPTTRHFSVHRSRLPHQATAALPRLFVQRQVPLLVAPLRRPPFARLAHHHRQLPHAPRRRPGAHDEPTLATNSRTHSTSTTCRLPLATSSDTSMATPSSTCANCCRVRSERARATTTSTTSRHMSTACGKAYDCFRTKFAASDGCMRESRARSAAGFSPMTWDSARRCRQLPRSLDVQRPPPSVGLSKDTPRRRCASYRVRYSSSGRTSVRARSRKAG